MQVLLSNPGPNAGPIPDGTGSNVISPTVPPARPTSLSTSLPTKHPEQTPPDESASETPLVGFGSYLIDGCTKCYCHRGKPAELVPRTIVAVSERGCPTLFPSEVQTDMVDLFGVCIAPTKDGVLDLASNAALVEASHDGEAVLLLVCKPPTRKSELPTGHVACLPNDHPTKILVPMMPRPLVLQRCNAVRSYHFGVLRTLRVLEFFFWCVGVDQCVRWWLGRCFKCEARMNSRRIVRRPMISILLPNGSGEAISLDYLRPLPTTRNGKKCMVC